MNQYYIILIILIILIIIVIFYFYIYPLYTRYILRNISIELFTSLNKHNVEYWADFGTLLGIVRDNDIIWWDNDVDVVVVDNPELHQKMQLVKDDLAKKGYKTEKQNWNAYRVKKHFLYADLYINSINNNKGVYIGATNNTDIPIECIGKCTYIIWKKYNIPVRVPENIHETLVSRYGEDYMTPKRGFKGRGS